MGKIKITAILLSAAILMACMVGCASESSDSSSAPDVSQASVNTSALGNHIALPLDGPPISINERDTGTWTSSFLFYGRKEGGTNKTTGRYEGDGVLKITRTGYEFKFVWPDGQVQIQSKGTFRTGVQASYVGDTTIKDYPYAMLTSNKNEMKIEFLTDDLNESISSYCYRSR